MPHAEYEHKGSLPNRFVGTILANSARPRGVMSVLLIVVWSYVRNVVGSFYSHGHHRVYIGSLLRSVVSVLL